MFKMQPLTEDQKRQYQEEGYVMVGRVMDDATLDAIRAEEFRFRTNPMPNDDPKPGQLTIFRSMVCNYSEPVRQYMLFGPQLQVARDLVGPNVAIWYNQFVTKFPDAGAKKSEFPWHQDEGYTPLDPATSVTIWVALDDVDEKNGCVWVVPGSHRKGLLPHQKKSADSWHLTVQVDGDGVPAKLKAGEAVAFWGLTLHRSKENFTDKPRRGFFMSYCDAATVAGADRQPVARMPERWVVLGQAPIPPKK